MVDAGGAIVAPGLHRLPHALRPVRLVGPARRPDAAARRDDRSSPATARCRSPRSAPPIGGRRATSSASSRTSRSTRSSPGSRGRGSRIASGATRSRAHGTAVNIAALVGHSNLRVYVMGDAAWERAATPGERDALCRELADALAAGALGMSTSFVDTDRHARRGAEPRRRRRRARRADRRARSRARDARGARVPPVDQGARPPARRHRARRAVGAGAAGVVHVEPARREQPRPQPGRADPRAGPFAACRRMPRCTRRCRRGRST